ncbi:MAG: hypothetical protein EBZ49_07885 [Proteobacteria bacterium]|nr:hypothetical protein [Pseudomonadota bacterium]NDC24035.1 hypothetical protein [Pseudomonadota bacterium]
MHCCSVCKNQTSKVVMNNRFICFRCDELLFDIEIECDEKETIQEKTTPAVSTLSKGTKLIGSK